MQVAAVVSMWHGGRFGLPLPLVGGTPRGGPPFYLRGWAAPRGGLTLLRSGAPPLRGVCPRMIQYGGRVDVIAQWRQLRSLGIKWELSHLCKLYKLVVLLFGCSEFRASCCWIVFIAVSQASLYICFAQLSFGLPTRLAVG